MKELSIEEKARAYDNVREKIAIRFGSNVAKEIFSEYEESEDEKIRKELIAMVKLSCTNGDDADKKIAWLEKQKGLFESYEWNYYKDKPVELWNAYINGKAVGLELGRNAVRNHPEDYGLEKQGEQNPIDKIQLGKKYKCIASPRYSTFRIGEIYKPEDKFLYSLMNFCSDCFEPIEGEQKPAYTKEYDFHGIKFIPKFAKGDIIKDKKCGEVSTIEDFSYDTGLYTHTYGQFPITIQDNYEIIEQESAWSEEDDYNLQCCIAKVQYDIDNGRIGRNRELLTWLKSLKDRVQPQPKQEWSEEDIVAIDCAVDVLNKDLPTLAASIKRLKSLRPQNHWKPSEEQMDALHYVTNFDYGGHKATLVSLYEQLKKLREE